MKFLARRATLRRWVTSALRAGLIAAVALLALEIVFRVTLPEQLWAGGALAPVYMPDEKIGYRYVPNGAGTMCVPLCRPVEINPAGLLGPHFREEKDEGVYRIAIIDASNATGLWMVEGNPYPAQLEEMLESAGVRAEVFNFSIDGEDRAYEMSRLALDVVPRFSPDLVLQLTSLPFVYTNNHRTSYRGYVVNYIGNIPSALDHVKAQIDYIESHRVAIAIYRASYIARALARFYVGQSQNWRVPYVKGFIEKRFRANYRATPLSTKKSIELLAHEQRTLEERGTKVRFVTYATGKSIPEEAIERGLEFATIRNATGHVVDVKHNAHPDVVGQRLIAEQLFELLPWGEGRLADILSVEPIAERARPDQ